MIVVVCLVILTRAVYALLFIQFCGIVSPFSTTTLWNQTLPLTTITFHSSVQRGHIAVNLTDTATPVLAVSRYACDAAVLGDALLSAVKMNYHQKQRELAVDVWSDQAALKKYDVTMATVRFNAACLNEISTLSFSSWVRGGGLTRRDSIHTLTITVEGTSYDCLLQFPEPVAVDNLQIALNEGLLDVSNVVVKERMEIAASAAWERV